MARVAKGDVVVPPDLTLRVGHKTTRRQRRRLEGAQPDSRATLSQLPEETIFFDRSPYTLVVEQRGGTQRLSVSTHDAGPYGARTGQLTVVLP
jgi:hypothetical protein